MNLLSSVIINHIIKALEAAFLAHLPELQQQFLNEVSSVLKILTDWIELRLSNPGDHRNEEKNVK